MTQYAFYFDSTRCTGCRTCEMACKDYKDSSEGIHFRKVYDYEGGICELDEQGICTTSAFVYHMSLGCQHCNDPACVQVCPTGATFKREDGIVVMDPHRCIGCRFCMAGCPFGARSFNFVDPRKYLSDPVPNPAYPTRMIGVVEKCTFCAERLAVGQMPACVEAAGGRILFGDLNDPKSDVCKALASNYSIRRKPNLGTQPGVYYLI